MNSKSNGAIFFWSVSTHCVMLHRVKHVCETFQYFRGFALANLQSLKYRMLAFLSSSSKLKEIAAQMKLSGGADASDSLKISVSASTDTSVGFCCVAFGLRKSQFSKDG